MAKHRKKPWGMGERTGEGGERDREKKEKEWQRGNRRSWRAFKNDMFGAGWESGRERDSGPAACRNQSKIESFLLQDTKDSHVSVGSEGTGLWEQPMEDPVSVGDLGVETAEPRVR